MVNSRAKGARAERDARDMLNSLGFKTRRWQQYAGGPDSPDVVGIPGIHIEVKMVEALNLDAAMNQSEDEADTLEVPIVMHRKKGTIWKITAHADLIELLAKRWLQGLGWDCQPPRKEP